MGKGREEDGMELVVERMMEPSSNQEMGWQVSFDSRLRAMGCDSIEPRLETHERHRDT